MRKIAFALAAVGLFIAAVPLTAAAAPAPGASLGALGGDPAQHIWQVAGMVNLGEPTLRVVYDTSVPGSRDRALSAVSYLQGRYSSLPQPGSTAGLTEVGYSQYIDGLQVKLYSNSPFVAGQYTQLLADAGLPLTLCNPSTYGCPGYLATA
jgi:hypothetical protein